MCGQRRSFSQETSAGNPFEQLFPSPPSAPIHLRSPDSLWHVVIASGRYHSDRPPRARRLFFFFSPPSLLFSLLSGAGVGGVVRLCWDGLEAVIPSASLTSCMALQGYGDDLAGPNEWSQFGWFVPSPPPSGHLQEHLLGPVFIYRGVKSV